MVGTLSIDCGTDMEIRNIRLLYARPDSAALADIIEKFRFETGIFRDELVGAALTLTKIFD